jgi:histone deacetylase complex regulatory component SIN3
LKEEYETAKKKKQALDNLLDSGRISQSTHDLFDMEIAEAITDTERQQKALLQKMNAKMMELEEQIKTLEILLANFEIQHVTGEIDEGVYQREINVLSMGLETSKQELETIKEATEQLASGIATVEQETQPQLAENVVVEEKPEKAVVEFVDVAKTDSSETKESQSAEMAVEGEEKQET